MAFVASYRADPSRPDRIKAIAAVALVHALIAAAVLNSRMQYADPEGQSSTDLIDIPLPPPPPPPPPPPEPRADRSKEEEGVAGRKAEPTEIVAPSPPVVVPAKPPVAAAPIAGTGSASSAGAATSGTGTGAGGSGSGRGGGGTGDFSGYTPARLVQNVRRSDYRALAAGRVPTGSAMVAIRIEPDGSLSNCRIARSSGDAVVDGGLCGFLTKRLRFRPALDDRGRPIPYSTNYVATWSL